MTTSGDFTVDVHTGDDGTVVVTVAGDLDYASHTRLEDTLTETGSAAALVVDLADVPYCDSCGLRVLLGGAQRQERAGGTFTLRGVEGQPRRALRLTGLDTVLDTVPGADAATGPSTDGPAVQA